MMKKTIMIFAMMILFVSAFAQIPSGLSTNTASRQKVTCTSFKSGSAAFNFGATPWQARGVVYGVTPNPTIMGSKVVAGGTVNAYAFEVTITGLTRGTKYYYRSYASNNTGTAYGPEKNITMSTTNSAPSGISAVAHDVDCSMFMIYCPPFDGGCQTITDCGVCWSTTNSNPTQANNHIHSTISLDGSFGAYTNTLESFNPNTLVYIRTWATNASGTTYSTASSVRTCASCDDADEDGFPDVCIP